MENANPSCASSTKTAWILCAITAVGMLIFAALYFQAPKYSSALPQTTALFLTNTVVSMVTNEVTKEVEKIVRVPAEIPKDYITAMQVYSKITNASSVTGDFALFGMNDVQTRFVLADNLQNTVTETEIRARFELVLRRNNVLINPTSPNVVTINVNGFLDETYHTIVCYSVQCHVDETQFVFRSGECHLAVVRVWDKAGPFGIVGKEKANETLLTEVEKRAEIFANDFLSSNPKQK